MGQHTPEPWHRDGIHINAGSCSRIGTEYTVAGVAANVNADRIVSCVNALTGIPDPAAWVKAARELANQCESVLVVMALAPSDLDGDQPDLELNNMEDAVEELRAADRSPQ